MAMLFNCTTGAPYQAPEGLHALMLQEQEGVLAGTMVNGMDAIQQAQQEQELAAQAMQEQLLQQQAREELVPENAALLVEMLDRQAIADDEAKVAVRKEIKKDKQKQIDDELNM